MSSAQASTLKGGAPRPRRPCPRRSGAITRNERPRYSSEPYQLRAAVAIQPCSSTSAGAPGGPAISQAHVEEPVARGTVRPIGPLVGAPPITLVVTLAGGT